MRQARGSTKVTGLRSCPEPEPNMRSTYRAGLRSRITPSPGRPLGVAACVLGMALLALTPPARADAAARAEHPAPHGGGEGRRCPAHNAGLTLPAGFCATLYADHLGHVRHMVASDRGVLYVNTWSGRYYGNDQPPAGGFLIALPDTHHRGRADRVQRFGPDAAQGSAGGTGIALWHGWLYAEINDRIVRWKLGDAVLPKGEPETIVSGMPLDGDHPMHPFAIDADGGLYVDLGSASNACQRENRMPGSPGVQPCRELETRGGIWRYEAERTGQVFSPQARYATGIRNAVGIAVGPDGHEVYATQHGRDQLSQNFPKLYTVEQGAALPAEELLRVQAGGDYGWPECYFDERQGKLVLAPEYGGDGGHAVGACATRQAPVAAFPAHWAPDDVLIYAGRQFPAAFRGGAFIAFHGSWNRAPLPQGGYNLVFQPLANGKAAAPWIVFAEGFAGGTKNPGSARHRPAGLAVGADGALFVSDDEHGRIWRIDYQGPSDAPLAGVAPAEEGGESAAALPPEGLHPRAGTAAELARLNAPPGADRATLALGAKVFAGQEGGAACTGCHGNDGGGTPLGPDLTQGRWIWSDGSVEGLQRTITEGVAKPKVYPGVMPPMGGAQLTDGQLRAVAAYVWALGHSGRKGSKPAD